MLTGWAASATEPIARHGWGAVALTGVLVACLLIIVLSGALIAWRVFKPLKEGPDARPDVVQPSTSSSEKLKNDRETDNQLSVELIQVLERLENLESVMKAPDQPILTGSRLPLVAGRFDKIEQRLPADGASAASVAIVDRKIADIGLVVGKLADELRASIESERRQSQIMYRLLSTSLRARDAEVIFSRADEVIMRLGPQLIQADATIYPNGRAWAVDHNEWGWNLDKVDGLLSGWMDRHAPFHDVKRYDYEREERKAPNHILGDEDQNPIRYKHVCIAFDRYTNARNGIINFFALKAGELPP